MSETKQVADALLAFLREHRNVDAYRALYADDAECIEADPARSRNGLTRLAGDMQGFVDTHAFKYVSIDGPLIAGETFALGLRFEATPRDGRQTFTFGEIGVYTVRNGKIVREQFFYDV